MKYAVIALALLLTACTRVGPPLQVEIVAVIYDEELGREDWYTIVEFPDGDRRRINGKFGEVGDVFRARKTNVYPGVVYLKTSSS